MAKAHRTKRFEGRKDSSLHQFLSRVPGDLVEKLKGRRVALTLPASGNEPERAVTTTLGVFVKFSLQTRDGDTADVRRKAVRADLAKVFDAARRGPAPLSQRQITALSGEVYRELIRQNGENPGTPEQWESFKALTRAAVEGKIPSATPIRWQGRADDEIVCELLFGNDATAIIDAASADQGDRALEQRVGRITFWVLDRHGLEIDSAQRLELMRQVARAALQAAWTLKAMSKGDYRPDPDAVRFPEFRPTTPVPERAGVKFEFVHKAWCASEAPRPGSRSNRHTATRDFAKHAGTDDMTAITGDHVMAWRDSMMEGGYAASSIKTKLADLRSAFSYARSRKIMNGNPFADLKTTIKATRLPSRDKMRGYPVQDVARILALASKEKNAGRRWLPLLAATTGARISELTQLWADRVCEIEGIPHLRIRAAEDGGSVKTEASARDVPIHPAVIEAGFLEFVRSRGDGPLFYRKRPVEEGKPHPGRAVGDAVGKWIRAQGFTDEAVAPNHGFRHAFKTLAHRSGIDSATVEYLQGHRTPGEASRYLHVEADRPALLAAVSRIPVPAIAVEADGAMPTG